MFPKKADSNEYFASGRGGRPDVFVAGDPNANGGLGIRSVVRTPSGGTIKRQIGGVRPPERRAGIRNNPAAQAVLRSNPFGATSPTVNRPLGG